MLKVPLNEVKDDLSRYLRLAETENVIITRHGVPAGLLVGFEDPEDWWEALLLRDERFAKRISEARASLRAGDGITLEAFREQHGVSEKGSANKKGAARTKGPGAVKRPTKRRGAGKAKAA
jgi:prevent-host-death family protein